MCFQQDLFLDLPEEIKRLIVTDYLDGGSLCNALRVSRDWNFYFKKFVWQDKTIGKALRERLEKNWEDGICVEKEEYWSLDGDYSIGAVSPNYFALTSPYGTILEEVRIKIFELRTGNIWSLENVFYTVLYTAKRNVYEIEMTDKFVVIRVELRDDGNVLSHQLLVWKMGKEDIVINKKIQNLQTFQVSCNERDDDILILHGEHLEIWDINMDNQIKKVESMVVAPTLVFSVCYISPYIVQSFLDPLTDTRIVKVWKFTREEMNLDIHIQVDDFDRFVHDNGTQQAIRTEEIIYYDNFFLISCICPLMSEGDNDDIKALSFKMLSDTGDILRECFMPQYNVHANVVFFPFFGRITISIDKEVFIIKDLLRTVDGDDDKQIELKKMGGVDGTHELFFRRKSCNTAVIINFDDGLNLLSVQSMDFWDGVDFHMRQ